MEENAMEMPAERSKPLHNFSLPYLRWGTQMFLRCMKITSNGEALPLKRTASVFQPNPIPRFPRFPPLSRPIRPSPLKEKSRVESVRFEFADPTSYSVLNEVVEESGSPLRARAAAAAAVRPWNLRTRRSAAPSLNGEDSTAGETSERPAFSISLSREDIEDDFEVMAGKRLPRRPKKRPKIVQQQLDMVFPGLWLTEVNEDSYFVPELQT